MRKCALIAAGVALASGGAAPLALADQGSTPPGAGAHIRLAAMPRGTARPFLGSDGDLRVRLDVTGVTPGSEHSVDIDRGRAGRTSRFGAGNSGASVVTADATGQIHQTVDTGTSARLLRRGPFTLTIREGVAGNPVASQNALATQGIAYAPLGHRLSAPLRLRPVPTFHAMPRGWASFSYNASDPSSPTGQSVTVTIRASGFEPGTTHAAHVHSGSCASQGAVVVMLPDLTADAGGNVSATDTVPVNQAPQGPLYINVHQGNSNTILSANGTPTLSFRPLLCGDVTS